MTGMIDIVRMDAQAAPLLAALHAASFYRPGDETWSERAFANVLNMPGAFALIAQTQHADGPRPVGFSVCRMTRPEAELLSLGVIPEHRQLGTARRLIDASVARCRQADIQVLYLEVAEDNPPAQTLYSSLGFEQVGRRPAYYARLNNQRVDALTMQLSLSRGGKQGPSPENER